MTHLMRQLRHCEEMQTRCQGFGYHRRVLISDFSDWMRTCCEAKLATSVCAAMSNAENTWTLKMKSCAANTPLVIAEAVVSMLREILHNSQASQQ